MFRGSKLYTGDQSDVCNSHTHSASLPVAQVGLSYSQTFTASGGTAPYTFSLTGGNLPNAVGLVSNGAFMGKLFPEFGRLTVFTSVSLLAFSCPSFAVLCLVER